MAIVVIGSSGRNTGKTTLACALISALREFEWIAVKITSHTHSDLEPIHGELSGGDATDTARYLTAGARRAFLVTASDDQLPLRLNELRSRLDPASHLLFESNRIVAHIEPDLCLAIADPRDEQPKPSFTTLLNRADAIVTSGHADFERQGKPVFTLESIAEISAPMLAWLREKLRAE